MLPHLDLLGWQVATPLLALVLAVVVGIGLGAVRARQGLGDVGPMRVIAAIAVIAVVVFAGGRAHYIYNRWHLEFFQANPLEVFRVWRGLHAPGALLALVVGAPVVLKLFRIPVARFADAFAPAAFVGIAVARLGCFLNGCCIGIRCEGLLCLAYPPGSRAQRVHMRDGTVGMHDWSDPVHPFALYLVAVAVVAALIAHYVGRRGRYAGQGALVSAVVYFVGAAVVETVRSGILPPSFGWAGISQLQLNALGLVALSAIAWVAAEGVASGGAHAPVSTSELEEVP